MKVLIWIGFIHDLTNFAAEIWKTSIGEKEHLVKPLVARRENKTSINEATIFPDVHTHSAMEGIHGEAPSCPPREPDIQGF